MAWDINLNLFGFDKIIVIQLLIIFLIFRFIILIRISKK
ncbi:hypothetical protein F935_03316 [Acinetobacter calcoaceticus ANC 3811]|uniref:Uncharacterized protein n=1 Tax=Acinetobacter calcoaceticus ANC 3811 TaxID=1217690 RepID=R8XV04_ACICA|nr:hypothetical protein F935_03316 [Acinetobacter calcoaceticus ANC 3811]